MIRLAKRAFREEIKKRLELWEEHLKDPIVAPDKALKCAEDRLEALWMACDRVVSDLIATIVGRGPVAFSGCLG